MTKKVVVEFMTHMTRLIPFIVWQVATLGVLIIIMCMLSDRVRNGASKKRVYSLYWLALVLLVIVAVEYYERSQVWFTVTSEEMPVYMGPEDMVGQDNSGKKYPRLYSLKLHDEVRVIKKKGAWLQIEDNGRKGWIRE